MADGFAVYNLYITKCRCRNMNSSMKEPLHIAFARFMAGTNAVQFGDFTLKSGKKSEVFINFGEISSGNELIALGSFFAEFIVDKSLHTVEVLFGPAYKGINIAIAVSIALHQKYDISIPFAYNRKTPKGHGEGGNFTGYDLNKAKSALILDDVITDGGTKLDAIKMLSSFPDLKPKAVIVGVDREETDEDGKSCRLTLMEETGIDVLALTTKSEVLGFR